MHIHPSEGGLAQYQFRFSRLDLDDDDDDDDDEGDENGDDFVILSPYKAFK